MKLDDALVLAKFTVAMEAEGESKEGKLGVAYVIYNRTKVWKKSISDVILADWQFTCWDRGSPTKQRLDVITDALMDDAEKAVLAAFTGGQPDPTFGATHYLNEPLTRSIRGGSLPDWVDKMEKTAIIGKHTFFKSIK